MEEGKSGAGLCRDRAPVGVGVVLGGCVVSLAYVGAQAYINFLSEWIFRLRMRADTSEL